jgi:6,7-dimethyl-8-ribityllumazine synthase
MPNIYKAPLVGKDFRFAIICSRFNELISGKLLDGALDCLSRHEVAGENIDIFWVPGSFEIPITAELLADSGRYHTVICLGAVMRGDTSHHQYIAAEVVKGIAQVGLKYHLPVILGVLTPDNLEQALERAGTKSGNKGFEAALSALEMANLFASLPGKAGDKSKK